MRITKRLLAFVLTLVVCVSLAAPAMAAQAYPAEYYEYLEWATNVQENPTDLGLSLVLYPRQQVKELSETIVGSETDPYKKAELFNEWIMQNIKYGFAMGTVFDKYMGHCEEFSQFFQALCNEQGIPCFIITGQAYSLYDETYGGGHAWNLFFANGEWHWADTTWDTNLGSAIYFDASNEKMAEEHITLGPNCTFFYSDWAKESLETAITYRLIDKTCVNEWKERFLPFLDFRTDCTRKSFAQLAINLLEVCYDKDIDDILTERGLTPGSFDDTDDPDVLAANALGIVNGVGTLNGIGDNCYNPDGFITRQEAAAILGRTAKVMGITAEGSDITKFSDYDRIGTWARDSVAFVNALGVMEGTSATTFDPLTAYTREQCVITMVRLYEAAQ